MLYCFQLKERIIAMKKIILATISVCILFSLCSCSSYAAVKSDTFENIAGYQWKNVKNFSEGLAAVKKDKLLSLIHI